ncbi:GRAM [Nesidiocoris tenuis]|uniref:GRAM n=2 Tax=Nesidiocoris tenuis TaxID=355587 RepID=A0ABN7A949_9HEMI|nr:GRAM [Nesidiocoris tenuis]
MVQHNLQPMVQPELVCFVQEYTALRIKPPPSSVSESSVSSARPRKKKYRLFGVLKKRSLLSTTSLRDDDEFSLSSPNAAPSALVKHRVEMVPGGRTGSEPPNCMTAQQCASAAAAAAEILISTPGSSKARQKKFHRHFKTVPPDEKVINYYSCALIADILLQGHLYITRNYFAFYSNVFGYVTKLLIPTSTVLKVTKEKTAYIIPNAVGITTEVEKHVFGSLLSRDSTYKLMVQVWNAAVAATPIHTVPAKIEGADETSKDELDGCSQMPVPVLNDDESSLSGSESNLDSKITNTSIDTSSKGAKHKLAAEAKSYHDMFSQTPSIPSSKESYTQFYHFLSSIPRPTLLLVLSTFLLVILFASAAILLFRISRLQQGLSEEINFSGRSASEVQAFINNNLEHISKVRQTLERLSELIESSGPDLARHRWFDVASTLPSDKFGQHNNS